MHPTLEFAASRAVLALGGSSISADPIVDEDVVRSFVVGSSAAPPCSEGLEYLDFLGHWVQRADAEGLERLLGGWETVPLCRISYFHDALDALLRRRFALDEAG